MMKIMTYFWVHKSGVHGLFLLLFYSLWELLVIIQLMGEIIYGNFVVYHSLYGILCFWNCANEKIIYVCKHIFIVRNVKV